METHRYTRKLASHHSKSDLYNCWSDLQDSSPEYYWTNGTTHLMSSTPGVGSSSTSASTVSTPPPTSLPTTPSQPATATRDNHVVRNSLMAGSISGMASTAVIYPLDVIRTKMQSASILASSSTGSTGTGNSASAAAANAAANRGPLQVLKHTLQHGGVRALYTGLTLPLAAQAIYKGTVFTVNNVMQTTIIDWRTWENHKTGIMRPGQLQDWDRFWCGAVAGGVNAALFVTPVEFIRNQLIAQHTKLANGGQGPKVGAVQQFAGSWDVVRHSMRQHGVAALWRGVSWSIYRDTLGCGCFFYAMAWTQHQLTEPGEQPGMTATIVSGGVAGLSFWVASLPLDTIKTWVQSSDLNTTVSAQSAVQNIYRNSGVVGVVQQLFRGWQVAYTRGIPSAAITITIYSWAYRYLDGGGGE
jgi:hypothetical protein